MEHTTDASKPHAGDVGAESVDDGARDGVSPRIEANRESTGDGDSLIEDVTETSEEVAFGIFGLPKYWDDERKIVRPPAANPPQEQERGKITYVRWEDDVYRIDEDTLAPEVRTPDGGWAPVSGKLTATLYFEGMPVENPETASSAKTPTPPMKDPRRTQERVAEVIVHFFGLVILYFIGVWWNRLFLREGTSVFGFLVYFIGGAVLLTAFLRALWSWGKKVLGLFR